MDGHQSPWTDLTEDLPYPESLIYLAVKDMKSAEAFLAGYVHAPERIPKIRPEFREKP